MYLPNGVAALVSGASYPPSLASVDTAKQTFYFTLLTDLNKYPSND